FNQVEINMVPSFVPVGYGFRVAVTGLTHNFKGYPITNDIKVHRELVTRLVNKIIKNEEIISDVEIINPDAKTIIVSYGISSRAVYPILKRHRDVGLFRPRTLWPFPESKFKNIVKGKKIIVLEMNLRGYGMEVERVGRKYGAEDFKSINLIGGEVPKPSQIEEVL
ncbi:MAG: 2-oxoacid:acceptor oxidoreductase subunit alpha, partial [Thermoplasmata archaeon]